MATTELPDQLTNGTPADVSAPALAPPRQWNAGQVIVAVVTALVLGALFNANDLLATAQRQPFGRQRDVALALAEPLASASSAIGLTSPRTAMDRALGRLDDDASLSDDDASAQATPTTDPDASPGSQTPPTDEPEPVAVPVRGPISATEPLRLYIGGDSMIGQFGGALADLADDTGVIEVTEVKYEFGSGLSRPDYVDWPARLEGVVRSQSPEVMVLFFGGNDAQPLQIDGVVRQPEEPEWLVEYRSRVAAVMDQLVQDGVVVYWMGMPIPRSETMVIRLGLLNEVFESEAALRDDVHFVPSWELFAGPDGKYSEYLPDRNGDVVDMRLNDGIHLTTAGAYRLARPTITQIMADYGIPAPAQG